LEASQNVDRMADRRLEAVERSEDAAEDALEIEDRG
jgi:hypothetical protein